MREAILTDLALYKKRGTNMNNYPHLFSPLRVRGKLIKNRIFSAPMGVGTITPFYTREHLEL